ncbi:MAG: hypothetical protein ACR2G0_11855 [Chthoniobacterales bacterium]
MRYFFLLLALGVFALASCSTNQPSQSAAGTRGEGSGLSDASQVNGGTGAGAAAGSLGHPGN